MTTHDEVRNREVSKDSPLVSVKMSPRYSETLASANSEVKKKTSMIFYDFMGRDNSNGVAASSSSSGITDLTTTNEESDDHEESTSSFNSFTTFRRKK